MVVTGEGLDGGFLWETWSERVGEGADKRKGKATRYGIPLISLFIAFRGFRQIDNEIHTYFLLLLEVNRQRLKCTSWFEVFGLDSSTDITLSNISSDFLLHASPPKPWLEVLIHFCAPWLNG